MYLLCMFSLLERTTRFPSTIGECDLTELWQTMNCDLYSPIPDWIIEYRETTSVFDRLGLDTSCGGKSLEYLCVKQDLSPALVLQQLEAAIRSHECGLPREEKFD